MTDETLARAERAIGYAFRDRTLLETALTHSSFVNEHGGHSNERLEFLGDALVGFLVAEALFAGEENEGQMTERRKRIVSKKPLAAAVRALGLDRMLRAGRGETTPSEKTVSDIFEAVAAAVYLDGGLEACRAFVLGHLKETEPDDCKSALQRYAQKKFGCNAVRYDSTAGSPAVSTVYLGGEPMGRGKGRTLSDAEREAAREALGKLGIGADFI